MGKHEVPDSHFIVTRRSGELEEVNSPAVYFEGGAAVFTDPADPMFMFAYGPGTWLTVERIEGEA